MSRQRALMSVKLPRSLLSLSLVCLALKRTYYKKKERKAFLVFKSSPSSHSIGHRKHGKTDRTREEG